MKLLTMTLLNTCASSMLTLYSTAGEVRFVSKANDKQKAATKKAYRDI